MTMIPQRSHASPLTRSLLCLAAGLAVCAGSQAATIIPKKEGFGGFVNLGAGSVSVESNLIASIANGIVDIGDKKINSLYDSPGSDSAAIPTLNFELSYTFAKSRTQVYIGNLLEDFLSFDMNTRLGIRQEVQGAGIFGLALLKTSLPTDVWEDPYLVGEKRKDTERTGTGYRLNWQQILGTGLEVAYSSQSIDIDNERSGQGIGLSPAERKLLNRNGDISKVNVNYEFNFGDGRHLFTPGVTYFDNNIDGDAMSNNGYGVNANYIYKASDTWRWVLNASYAKLDYDKANPIYGEKDGVDRYGVSGTVFYSEPFGWKKWALNLTAAYYDDDHDIDFYDTTVGLVSVGMLRHF